MAENIENNMDTVGDMALEAKPPDSEFDVILSGEKGSTNREGLKVTDMDTDSFVINEDTVNGSRSLTLSIGTKVEVKDFDESWSSAQILEVDYEEMEVLVHYDNIKRHDEWISVTSPRIRPLTQCLLDISSPSVQLTDCLEMPPEHKAKQHFEVGERCLARWNNNSKFTATVHQVLDNDKYEVMFDDGSTWKCNVVRLCKIKSEPSSTNTTPEPSTSWGVAPPTLHKHLFDPTVDYLGSKSERREKKRKLNIKELFNIGQTKRYCKRTPNVARAQAKPARSDHSANDNDLFVKSENTNRKLSPEPEDSFQKFEKTNEDNHKETICTMKEMISKLECSLGQTGYDEKNLLSPMLDEIKLETETIMAEMKPIISKEKTPEINVKEEIIKAKEEITKTEEKVNTFKDEIMTTTIVPSKSEIKTDTAMAKVDKEEEINIQRVQAIILAQKELAERRRLEKMRRLKRAKKIRQFREEKVKKEMEKVRNELEEMRKQVQEMKKAVQSKKKKKEEPLIDPATLRPQQWCCRWVAGRPLGKLVEDPEGISRYVVQVEDHRIPPTFTKLLMRRTTGSSGSKWDIVFISPENCKIHNRLEMKMYLENLNDESIKPFESALLDFALHRRLSRNIGWDDCSRKTKAIKIKIRRRNKEVSIVKKASKKKHKKHAAEPRKEPRKIRSPDSDTNSSALKPLSEEMMAKLLSLESNSLTSNYTLCGVLKAEVLCNMLRCPADACYKNFRTAILLQMHIKYYHKELVELMGAAPTVCDLAAHNVAPAHAKPLHKRAHHHRHLREADENVSPKARKGSVVPSKKRPRVLLPVRDAQPPSVMNDSAISEIEDSECAFQEEFEKKFPSQLGLSNELDFEAAISAHTVCKSKKRGKPSKVASDDEDTYSDLETQSSLARSGTPDSKMLQNLEAKEGELYYTNETGEKIKIVHMKREEIINCHCGFREEDGLMIQCELCLCWQHAICHNIHKETEVPEKYTCSICLNPRRGRRSRRFVHDQDRLYEGLLAGAAPCPKLRRAHELTGNLLRLADSLHALRVKRRVAETKNHPKLYLWAWEWEQAVPDALPDLDLTAMMHDMHAPDHLAALPDMPADHPDQPDHPDDQDDLDDQRLSQKSESSLSNLLSSPGGTTFDLPITTCELEKLAKAVQEPVPEPAPPTGPQPDAPMLAATSRHHLYLHVQRCQASIDARLDSIEAQVAELESQEPSMVDDETAEYFPRTKQTVQMLLRDLGSLEELGLLS